jgi:phosphoribosyl-AMP cyclohydrolase
MDQIEIEEGYRFVPSFNMQNQLKPSEELAVAIAQDAKTNEILRAACANRKAIEETLRTGIMHFWAPTGIWNIGTMSANPLITEKALVDCDQDAIIYKGGRASDVVKESHFREIINLDSLIGNERDENLINMARVGLNGFLPQFNMRTPSKPEEPLMLAIAQDVETREILMAAFANRAAIEATLRKGKATFFSRSRGPWTKGETSGNSLLLEEMLTDRAQEAVIYVVRKEKGGACHSNKKDGEPRTSCFYRTVSNLGLLRGKNHSLIDQAELSLIPGQE